MISTAGWTETTQLPADDGDPAPAPPAACARSSTPTSTATACSKGPTSTSVGASPTRSRGRFLYSGGIGSLDDLARWRGCARSTSRGVIVGKALYEQRFTVAEGQAALDGA